MDRPTLREGGVMGLWMSALGGEAFYEQDMPDCCRREARKLRRLLRMLLLRCSMAGRAGGGDRRMRLRPFRGAFGRREKGGSMKKKSALRADTTLAPEGEPEKEIYIRGLPLCCLNSLKTTLGEKPDNSRRLLSFGCSCGERWVVTSSLDGRVLGRFVTHAGPKVRGFNDGPSAA